MNKSKINNNGMREQRLQSIPKRVEIRQNSDGTRSIQGVAVAYNSLSEDMGFREVIRPGAFKQSLESSADLLLLYGHDENKVCARVSNSSLQLQDTSASLRFTAKLPNVSWANDLIALLESDLVGGMSFGFRCIEDQWTDTGEYVLREVISAEIFEISVVPSWPAYSATSVNLRSCPVSLRSKLSLRDDTTDDDDDDPCEDYDSIEDCPVCDEGNEEEYDEEECETLSLRRRVRAAEKRIAAESELETLRLRQRIQEALSKVI